MRPALVVGLAVLLVLAGCGTNVVDEQSSRSASVTPAPVPDESATRYDDELAPGVTRRGVRQPRRLVAAHVAVLDGTTYTVHRTERRTTLDGALRSRFEQTIHVGEQRYHYLLDIQRRSATGVDRRRIEQWVGENRTLTAETVGNRAEYRRRGTSRVVRSDIATNRQGFTRLFTSFDLRTTGSVERDGVTLYRLVVTNGTANRSALRDVSFVAWISERGVVREYRLSYLVTHDGDVVRVTVLGTFSALGDTTAPAPPTEVTTRPATDTPAGSNDDVPTFRTVWPQFRSASTGRSLAAVHAG